MSSRLLANELNKNQSNNNQSNSMEKSSSLENKHPSAKPEFPCILLKPTFHYNLHKSSPVLPTLSQINPVPLSTTLLTEHNLSIILPSTSWSSKNSLFFMFPYQITVCSYRKTLQVSTKFDNKICCQINRQSSSCIILIFNYMFRPLMDWNLSFCLVKSDSRRDDKHKSETSRCVGRPWTSFNSLTSAMSAGVRTSEVSVAVRSLDIKH